MVVVVLGAGSWSCQDMAQYQGIWMGDVQQSRLIRRGLDICTTAELDVREVGSTRLDATLRLQLRGGDAVCSDRLPGEGAVWSPSGEQAELALVPEILNDALANLSIDGDPLFTHLAWAHFNGRSLLAVLSVFRGQRMELRLMGPDVYAFFPLKKNGG